jgi:hypothetical protein
MKYEKKEVDREIKGLYELSHDDLKNISYSIMYNLTTSFSKNEFLIIDKNNYSDMVYYITREYRKRKLKKGSF